MSTKTEPATALFVGKTIAWLESDGEWTIICTTDGYQLHVQYRVRRYAPDEAWAEERREVAAETARWEETAAHLLEQKEAADKENTRLRAALTEIEQGDGNCLCPHDTDECCATQGSETFCAHCIAGRALAERIGRE